MLQRETLAVQLRVLGPADPDTLISQSNLAGILVREHRFEEAEKLASDTLDAQSNKLGPGHPDTVDTLRILGKAMAYRDRYAEASTLFRNTIDRLGSGADQGNNWSVWYAFACVAAAAGRFDESLGYLREAVNRGYKDADGLLAEEDLKELRRNPQFMELTGTLRIASKHGS